MRIRQFLFLLSALVFLPWMSGNAWAVVIRVKSDATGANNGSSWANAFTDLQRALMAAKSGDEIWVAAGTYTSSFILVAGAGLYGGFAGTETTRGQRNWKTHETILSGNKKSYHVVTGRSNAVLDGFTVKDGRNIDNIGGGGMLNVDVTLLKVTNCTFSGNTSQGDLYGDYNGHGGGMYNSNSSLTVTNCTFSGNIASGDIHGGDGEGGGMYNRNSSPTVTNCTFSGNAAEGMNAGDGSLYRDGLGGGMYNSNSSPTVTHCTFSGNTARNGFGYGGGMINANSSPTVTHCTFSGNTASGINGTGGGMSNFGSSPTVANCTFSGNSANGPGGGMYNSHKAPTVTNCTFSGNTARGDIYGGYGDGGGMYNADNTSPTLTNCTFSGNAATGGGGGGMYNADASPKVANCIIWGNKALRGSEVYKQGGTPVFRHCDIRDSGGSGAQWNPALGTDGGGNIMADPRFVDSVHPTGPDGKWRTSDDGFRLQANSPCINKGVSSGAPATDILGNLRSGLPDMGAYEYISPRNGVAAWAGYE